MAFPEGKNRASIILHNALKEGLLVRPDTCELCGEVIPESSYTDNAGHRLFRRKRIVAHHWNGYGHPLDIWWVCNSCNTLLVGERFHSGQVSREEARQIIKARRIAKTPTGVCNAPFKHSNGHCKYNTYNGNEYCGKHQPTSAKSSTMPTIG